jgi:hypothetical protein
MQFEDFREKMPEYDESIFSPELAPMALGFSMEDLADITEFVRWLYNQKQLQKNKPREKLIAILRVRQRQLADRRRLEPLSETYFNV